MQCPAFPTTTIGSFPQTTQIRAMRLLYKQGKISAQEYESLVDRQIAYAVGVQV